MNIIATNGYKRAGKGETAHAIEANVFVGKVKQVGFADKVKIFGARALGFLDRTEQECIDLMDIAKERWLIDVIAEEHDGMPSVFTSQITGRQYLQNVGTEGRKIFGDDFWVDQVLPRHGDDAAWAKKHVHRMHPDTDWLLITDLRFENEAQRVLDLGGEVWRVNRPGTESDGHDSEQLLPDKFVTREIDNSYDLRYLEGEVIAALVDFEGGVR